MMELERAQGGGMAKVGQQFVVCVGPSGLKQYFPQNA